MRNVSAVAAAGEEPRLELGNGQDEQEQVAESHTPLLDAIDFRCEGLSYPQRLVKRFLIGATFLEDSPEQREFFEGIQSERTWLTAHGEEGRLIEFMGMGGIESFSLWPAGVKCIVTMDGQDRMVRSTSGSWVVGEYVIMVSCLSKNPASTQRVAYANQLLVLMAIGMEFDVIDDELAIVFAERLKEVSTTAHRVGERFSGIKLAINAQGQLAMEKDGEYYGMNGEPLGYPYNSTIQL